jgi:exodeoxyribonuclease VII large subunit
MRDVEDRCHAHPSQLQEGAAVEVHGRIAVYEPQGQYQLVANLIQAKGEGALFQEFLRLKSMLEAEGLFDPERKREIPEHPQTIGIVTSATGAALRDMLNTIRRRQPLTRVILAPSPVQGVDAPPALVDALANFKINNKIPMSSSSHAAAAPLKICGHSTMSALSARLPPRRLPSFRALVTKRISPCVISPPTSAPRLPPPRRNWRLKPHWMTSTFNFTYQSRLTDLTSGLLADHRTLVSSLASRLRYVSPERRIQSEFQHLDELSRRAASALMHGIQLQSARVDGMSRRLGSLNPEGILSRGYAIITRKSDDKVVSKVSQAQGEMNVRVSDGEFEVNRKS